MDKHADMKVRTEPQPAAAKLWVALHVAGTALFVLIVASRVLAASHETAPGAFAAHCFSPVLTADTAAERLAPARVDFYDLRPFRAGTPVSEPVGAPGHAGDRPALRGRLRRCAYRGRHARGPQWSAA